MFAVIWEYEVRSGAQAAFEALYGSDGDWVALFRQYPGYLGTELLREGESRWLTIDRWTSSAAYEAFQAEAQPHYARIDEAGDALTVSERRIGSFTTP